LSWEESYAASSMLFGQPVIYEVKYWSKQQPEKVRDSWSHFLSLELQGLNILKGFESVS